MFWSEIGNEPKIERAGMDGSERRVVVSHSLSWPGGLALDALGDRIYWTDEKLQCIGSATLDGGGIKVLQKRTVSGWKNVLSNYIFLSFAAAANEGDLQPFLSHGFQ